MRRLVDGPRFSFRDVAAQVRHAPDLCISPIAQVHRVSDVCSSPLRTSAAHPKAPRGGHIGSDVPLASPETLRGASARALAPQSLHIQQPMAMK